MPSPQLYNNLLPRQDYAKYCQTTRAPSYYGLGVRLGIYFGWPQAFVANHFLASEIQAATEKNTIFLLALLVVLIKCSSINMLEQIDGLILMHLSNGTIFGILSLWGYRTRRYLDEGQAAIQQFGGFGTHARLILSLTISVYGVWYWTYAITGGLLAMGSPQEIGDLAVVHPNSPDCATLYTFIMFAKVRADGSIRKLYIFVSTIQSIYFGTMLSASTIGFYFRLGNLITIVKERKWATASRPDISTGFNNNEFVFSFPSKSHI